MHMSNLPGPSDILTMHNNSNCRGTTSTCELSSQCAGGSCCMPTRFGSYCTDVAYLVTTYNRFAAPWCKCDTRENIQAAQQNQQNNANGQNNNRANNRAYGFGPDASAGFGAGGVGVKGETAWNRVQAELEILNQPLQDPHSGYAEAVANRAKLNINEEEGHLPGK